MLPPEQVAPFLPERSQILSMPNHPQLRESYTLPLLLARAYTLAPDDTVFFAHGQGITWMGTDFEVTKRWWCLAMYRYLLSQPAMDASLVYPVVGWLKYEGHVPANLPFVPQSAWHYVGVCHWFRAREVYLRPWWIVPPQRYGAEAYQSLLFRSEQASSLLKITPAEHFEPNGVAKIYYRHFWEKIGIPAGPDADSYDGSPT